MLNQKLTAKQILESDFINRFLQEKIQNLDKQAKEETFGQPFEQYKIQYEEKRILGQGGMGQVILVKRKSDGQYFAAKNQLAK